MGRSRNFTRARQSSYSRVCRLTWVSFVSYLFAKKSTQWNTIYDALASTAMETRRSCLWICIHHPKSHGRRRTIYSTLYSICENADTCLRVSEASSALGCFCITLLHWHRCMRQCHLHRNSRPIITPFEARPPVVVSPSMSGIFSLPLLFSHEEVGRLSSHNKDTDWRALTRNRWYGGKLTDLHSRMALHSMKNS